MAITFKTILSRLIQNIIKNQAPHLRIVAALSLLLLFSPYSQAENHQAWLIFPQIDLNYRSGISHSSSPEQSDISPSVDFFYSSGRNEIKWLTELFVSDDKTQIERLQIGWSPEDDATIWLGRFHNPLGFWNSLAQHGAYMQTAVSRPHIIEYEHDGGLLPSHLSGVMAQFSQPTDAGGIWSYDLALGYGPKLDTQLEAMDIISPELSEHDLGATIRISYQPELYASKKIGIFASKVTIPTFKSVYQEIDQTILGLTGIWGWQTTELLGAIYYLNNQLKGANNSPKNSFTSAYIQVDHAWRPAWVAYLRLENTSYKDNDPYLQLFPDIQLRRTAIGFRHELTFNQALKFEIRDGGHLDDDFTEFTFQWSAFFP